MSEPNTDASPQAPRRRDRTKLALKVVIGMLVAILGLTTAAVYVVTERLADQVPRYPGVFLGMNEADRPQATDALTFLLVGTDSLAGEPTTGSDATASQDVQGSGRSDMIMLLHIEAGISRATAVSIPRDSWVEVPGHGMAKVNASYAYGGPTLLVHTVEKLTGIRVDHFAVIDFVGFRTLIDSVGGIDVNVAAPTTFGRLVLNAGQNHLDGAQALAYARQRTGLPRGDLDRVQRHQNALRALLAKVTAGGLQTNPLLTLNFLNELTRWITVDDSLTNDELRKIGGELRDLRPEGITFLTAPVAGPGRQGDQAVVNLDTALGAQLWHHLADGNIATYLRTYPGTILGDTTP